MEELSQNELYLFTKFQLLPSNFFLAEDLIVILRISDEKEFYKNLHSLSKKKLILKKSKKYSSIKLNSSAIKYLNQNLQNEIQEYLSFLQSHIHFSSNHLIIHKAMFADMALNYFKLFNPEWNINETELLNDTILYLYRTGKYKKGDQTLKKYYSDKKSETFTLIINQAKAVQLKHKAKYAESLALLKSTMPYLKKCSKTSIISQFYQYFFILLRLNARQSESMDYLQEGNQLLKEKEAAQIDYDRMLFGYANILIDLNEPEKSIEILQTVIENQLSYLDKLHLYLAESYSLLGVAYHYAGNTELAIQYSLTALEIFNFNYDTPSNEKASLHFTLASAYLTSENYGLAREEIEKAMEISTEINTSNHPDNSIYHSVAILLNKWMYEQPIKEMNSEFNKVKKFFPENHPIIGFFHNNMAMLYSDNKEYEKSNSHLLAAYQINYNVYQKDTINQAMLLSNMALNYEALEQIEEALSLLGRAEKILVSNLGKNHPDNAKLYQLFAQVYMSKEDYPKAITYLQKSSGIIEYYTKEHPGLVAIYTKMSVSYDSMNQTEKAYEYILKAYELFQAFFSNQASFMEIRLLNMLSALTRKLEKVKEKEVHSIIAFQKLREIWNELLFDEEMLTIAYTTCDNLLYDNKLDEARILSDMLEQSVSISRELSIEIDPKVIAALYNSIAMTAAADRELSFAINAMFRAVHILQRISNISDNYLSGYFARLVDLLTASAHHREMAIPYIKKLIEFEKNKYEEANQDIIINYYRALAGIYQYLKKFDKAVNYYSIALSVLNNSENNEKIYNLYLEIASAYAGSGMFIKSNDYTLRALHTYFQSTNKNIQIEASIIIQLASGYFLAGNISKAIETGHKAEDILIHKTKNKFGLINLYNMLSGFYNDFGDREKANEYLVKARGIISSLKIPQNSYIQWISDFKLARHLAGKKELYKALQLSEKTIKNMMDVNLYNDLFAELSYFIRDLRDSIALRK